MKTYRDEAPDLDERTIHIHKKTLEHLSRSKLPVLIGGGLALREYIPYPNDFGDLDIFCQPKDYPEVLKLLSRLGYEVWVKDERWLAKSLRKKAETDVIFGSPNGLNMVDESWFTHSRVSKALDEKITLLGPEHLLWCKLYVQNFKRFDGPDINHMLLKMAPRLDWELLLEVVGEHWELLLSALISFGFVYPSRRNSVPNWVMKELLKRLDNQSKKPAPRRKLCRGRLLSSDNYDADFNEGGFIEYGR